MPRTDTSHRFGSLHARRSQVVPGFLDSCIVRSLHSTGWNSIAAPEFLYRTAIWLVLPVNGATISVHCTDARLQQRGRSLACLAFFETSLYFESSATRPRSSTIVLWIRFERSEKISVLADMLSAN